jgi:hypothetical protein
VDGGPASPCYVIVVTGIGINIFIFRSVEPNVLTSNIFVAGVQLHSISDIVVSIVLLVVDT